MSYKPKLLEIGAELPMRLLVEGSDGFHTLCNLFIHHGLPKNAFGIKEKHGYTGILDTLAEELKKADLKTLGIVIDADEDLPARWQSLRDRLIEFGYRDPDFPKKPDPTGFVIPPQADLPDIGIWMMPDNQLPGILENFISLLIPDHATNPSWQYALQCVDGIPNGYQHFPAVRKPKAQLHTWLAWQKEPGKPIGQAIAASYFNPDSKAALTFIAWIKHLFQLT